MSKIDKKMIDVDVWLMILKEAGGTLKGVSVHSGWSDTYYYVKVKAERRLSIGDVYCLERYINERFGKGAFDDAYLMVKEGNPIENIKNELENHKKTMTELKNQLKSIAKSLSDNNSKEKINLLINSF